MSLSLIDFDYVRTLVQDRSAIVLEKEKVYLAESRLLTLARREGMDSPSELVARMRATPGNGLHKKVVEAMTTNETSFFRDLHPFEVLRRNVLPELFQRRLLERQLHIWSATCSTGQEPYSVAMLLHEHFPVQLNWNLRILATDLSDEVLQRARLGKYSQLEVNRGLPAPFLVKYFERHGADWHIRDEIRKAVEFRQLNLIEAWPAMPRMDIILLRNVLIYFDVPTKKAILARVRQLLRPDGYLLLGGAETTLNLDDNFERVEIQRSSCYRLRQA